MHLHIQPSDNMFAKELLYYYSSFSKDLQDAKEKAAQIEATKKRGKKTIRLPMASRK